MCGIVGVFGADVGRAQLGMMVGLQRHRGPDATGTYVSPGGRAALGHNRLSIIDLSDAGRQPMSDPGGRYWIAFNGEIYNYVELREELAPRYDFRTRTDTEVLLAAYQHWGQACLDRLIGMFAFAIWDEREQRLFAARDRFGVKPLHVHEPRSGELWLASEIKALHAAGVPAEPDTATWATYLVSGMYDHGPRTFWRDIRRVPPGGCLTWNAGEGVRERQWYDPAQAALALGPDLRSETETGEELLGLLEESVRLRFRADVPVGICLSGGLDSSLLLGLVHRVQGKESTVKTFTFFCGDPAYDETPWVEQMLAETRHPASFCRLTADEVPELAARVQAIQDEPFGGLPTLGMAKVHERAYSEGVTVLLDGNGLDEGWGGYEYYSRAGEIDGGIGPVQGASRPGDRANCLMKEFAGLALPFVSPRPFCNPLLDLQYRDIRYAKIPRAMRFADRVSMMYSRELREPFLDHRIVELGLRQPANRKIRGRQGKWLPRQIAGQLVPGGVREAPKRPVQTPQREWLRGPLRDWVEAELEIVLGELGGVWFDATPVRKRWERYQEQGGDNSFFLWQWLNLGLILQNRGADQVASVCG
ncbi:MAG TPA: asparagine synthase (glutamine-hydrolyzing) [Verrucomicrobiae bacterium]|nr:asparagine synthase (glutamine-hydrolyzing) [Verrucomicrobiae bacterium]